MVRWEAYYLIPFGVGAISPAKLILKEGRRFVVREWDEGCERLLDVKEKQAEWSGLD